MKLEDCNTPEELEDSQWVSCEDCGESWDFNDLEQIEFLGSKMWICPDCRNALKERGEG